MDSEPWKKRVYIFTKGFLPPSERGFTLVRRSNDRGRWRQRVTRLIHQTSTSPKYHRIVLGPRHVSTEEIRQEYFQERPICHCLQESKRSIRHQEFTASSLSHLLARYDGCVSKSDWTTTRVHGPRFVSRQWWQNTCVKSPFDPWRIPTLLPQKERSEISILKSTSIDSAHLKQAVLGERSTREKRPWVKQIFLVFSWKKTIIKT